MAIEIVSRNPLAGAAKTAAEQTPAAQFIRHTRVPTLAFNNAREVDRHVAVVVEGLIRENNSAGRRTVLGLPTGSTPIGVYRELARMHKEEGLDFSKVVTFNLDEYFPMEKESIHSYQRFMREALFDHVNIPKENIHIPDGTIPVKDVDSYCEAYERAIEKAGGIDLQILGIGRTGHIGFNEPGSPHDSRTRMVTLDPVTRQDAASDFFGEENVPMQAITMGVGTILEARKVVIIALGEHKAPIVRRAVEEPISEEVTASFLQAHGNVTFALDLAAASELDGHPDALARRPGPLDSGTRKTGRYLAQPDGEKAPAQARSPRFRRARAARTASRMRADRSHPATRFQRAFGRDLHAARREGTAENHRFQPPSRRRRDFDGRNADRASRAGARGSRRLQTSGNIAVFDDSAVRHTDFVAEFPGVSAQYRAGRSVLRSTSGSSEQEAGRGRHRRGCNRSRG